MTSDGTNVLQTFIPVVPDGYNKHFGAADPFIASDYVFAEIMKKKKGVIAIAKYTNNTKKLLFTPVLEEKFHLSYPQVFQHYNNWYMIPESHKAGSIILYKAKNFPYDWEKVETIYDIPGIDSTIFNISNQWYMLTMYNGKNLILTTNHFPYGPWNIIKENTLPTGYRGGGRAFYKNGKVLIPLQTPNTFLQGYGYKIEIYEIKQDLSMEHVRTINPPKGFLNGIHHLDCSYGTDNQCMVDLRMYKKR
jgi:hypothetical protein